MLRVMDGGSEEKAQKWWSYGEMTGAELRRLSDGWNDKDNPRITHGQQNAGQIWTQLYDTYWCTHGPVREMKLLQAPIIYFPN